MTGFGQAELETERFTIKVDMKSLNSKFLELNVRMPRNWQHKELELRRELGKWIERGTAQINIQLSYKLVEDRITPLNKDLALYYLNEVKQLSQESGWTETSLLNNIFMVPNILQVNEEAHNEEDWKLIMQTVRNAYEQFDVFRLTEGKVLGNELSKMAASILQKMISLAPFEEERLQTVKDRIQRDLAS